MPMSSAERAREHRVRQALDMACLRGFSYRRVTIEFLIREKRLALADSENEQAIRRALEQLVDDLTTNGNGVTDTAPANHIGRASNG
jgi:hypothetical protein